MQAFLFGPNGVRTGRVLYLDLDTIVVGSLDDLLSYAGAFGTLSADCFTCEADNKGGLNTSIMMWDAGACSTSLSPIWEEVNAGHVTPFLLRFDHWMEMLLQPSSSAPEQPADTPPGARDASAIDHLQEAFPGQIVDFNTDCAHGLPEGARIVCFPRNPKPHEATAPWTVDHWHNL